MQVSIIIYNDIINSVLWNTEWKPRTYIVPCSTSSVAAAPQTMQSSCSVVTCKELSSPHIVIASITKHVLNCSPPADNIASTGQPASRLVSVTDTAVEVGESLLASSSPRRHGREVSQSSIVVSLPSVVISTSLQSNVMCSTSMTNASSVQQSDLHERDQAFEFPNTDTSRQQMGHTVTTEQLPRCDAGHNHVSETSPIIIEPDESASPGYRLSCDEHSLCEKNAETSGGPLDHLAQSQASVCSEPEVCIVVLCCLYQSFS